MVSSLVILTTCSLGELLVALLRYVSFLLAKSTVWFLLDRQVHFCRFLVHFVNVLLVKDTILVLMSVFLTELTVADV